MADIYQDCYSCGKICVDTQFCADGGSFNSSSLRLPRAMKFRVIANPDFWGFGSLSGNTLIEGWGNFTDGYFEFFDGFDEDHLALKSCGSITTGPYSNEQRPDVRYRAVYDPENGDKHYSGTSQDGVVRGGAEAYLLDRGASQTSDSSSCDSTNPIGIFKQNPADYGSYPKILFNNRIYKNVTGAWRVQSCSGCYNTIVDNSLRCYECDGSAKQHIVADNHFAENYEPFQSRCLASGFASEADCVPDGSIASEYQGSITGVFRETGVSDFLKYHFQYNNGPASSLLNGQSLGIQNTNNQGVITLFDVTHFSDHTEAYAVGSHSNSNYSEAPSGATWIAFNTYDPNTCCGGAAYGVDPSLMNVTNSPLYHIDIGRVFNNPKNKIYSNRIDRSYNGLTTTSVVPDGHTRQDTSYIAVTEDGHGLLVEKGNVYDVDLADQTGVWTPVNATGYFPLFSKQLPYFGQYYITDRWDNAQRQTSYGNRERNRNATCYTKNGSLSIYPDCVTQSTRYKNCDPRNLYTINNVPRIALVYRGCNFEDPCSFDSSGRPYTAGASGHPSSMEDLVRGFGGQEITMFINFGTARGAEIKRVPCCCDGGCDGTYEPDFVEIPSPVTYPCFPKFDLYPSDYGCQDPRFYMDIMRRIGLDTDASGICGIPYYNACDPVQPYTTYGYIRNLCGKETNSRRGVIDSLSSKLHTGGYTDRNHTSNTVEPMYVEFLQSNAAEYPVGSSSCDPSETLAFEDYGSGAEANLVTDSSGNVSWNIISSGAGYTYGGTASFTTPVLYPTPSASGGDLILHFNAGALTGITAPATGIPTSTTFPLTINPGSTGPGATGGFTYEACGPSGYTHFWGLTDYQGRLIYPYFQVEENTTFICGEENGPYLDYSDSGTLVNGWPKDNVPFLVEIDHDDYCTGCSVTQMPTGNLYLTLESLDGRFYHNLKSTENDNTYGMYGWNHCKYPGIAVTPVYNKSTDSWNLDYCEAGDGLVEIYGQPYTGETCECADGWGVSLVPKYLEGTSVPIGYISESSGRNNTYLPFGECGLTLPFLSQIEGYSSIYDDHIIYASVSVTCDSSIFNNAWNEGAGSIYSFNGLGSLYGCNTQCATTFPAPNSAPTVTIDFFAVNRQYKDIFEAMDNDALAANYSLLQGNATFDIHSAWKVRGITGNSKWWNETGTSSKTCGSSSGYWDHSLTVYGSGGCSEVVSMSPSTVEEWLTISNCIGGQTGKHNATVTIDPCDGSRVVVYGCSQFNKGQYNRYHGNSDGKWGGTSCSFPVMRYPNSTDEASTAYLNDCSTATVPIYINSGNQGCFGENPSWFTTEAQAAYNGIINENYKPFTDWTLGCTMPQASNCCWTLGRSGIPGARRPHKYPNDLDLNFFEDDTYTLVKCPCTGIDNIDVIFDVTYSNLSGAASYDWYGDVLFPAVEQGNCDNRLSFLYWSGENIPGIGNIGPLPTNAPIAEYIGSTTFTQSACQYDTGPNRYAYIGAELIDPDRDRNTGGLVPETCGTSGIPYYGSCGTPYPFNTYSSGIPRSVTVNKKSCYPEIMTVHKIECVGDNYVLHVSREYFEHNRNWYYVAGYDDLGAPVLKPRYGLIQGGTESRRYLCEETYKECDDPLTGSSPTIVDYSFTLNMMVPTDSVSPVYPDYCATGTSPFSLTANSALGGNSSGTYGGGCLLYPELSGQYFWNFYNLLYDSGNPSASYLTDAGGGVYERIPDPDASCNDVFPHNLEYIYEYANPVFNSVSEMKFSHSCIQDFLECGGDIWCNKEFFPRRKYLAGTHLTAFGNLAICTQNAEYKSPNWLRGHTTTSWNNSPSKTQLAYGRLIDACDDNAIVELASVIEIDDNTITIPAMNKTGSSNSISTLMGVIHPGFSSTIDHKTCIYASSGECIEFLPTHNDQTLESITFSEDEFGYYLDKIVTSGSYDCLFTPFKIMVDNQCCPDRVAHRGTSDPTLLTYIGQIPAMTCNGWISSPACGCAGNHSCSDTYSYLGNQGPFLDGLACLPYVSVTPMITKECYSHPFDECFTTAEFSGASIQTLYIPSGTPSAPYIRFSDLNLVTSSGLFGYYEGLVDCYECSVSDGGCGAQSYFYLPSEGYTSVYEYGGQYYTIGDLSYVDVVNYKGETYHLGYNDHTDHTLNCCQNNLGSSGPDIVGKNWPSGTYGTFENLGGCDCSWNVCDNLRYAYPIGSSGLFDLPTASGAGVSELISTVLSDYGCFDIDTYRSCDYQSIVKLTITEG